tara:strand:- start:462 stop:746 length:285 start_codon:yes stop_codon:yes gene_type:complete
MKVKRLEEVRRRRRRWRRGEKRRTERERMKAKIDKCTLMFSLIAILSATLRWMGRRGTVASRECNSIFVWASFDCSRTYRDIERKYVCKREEID